MEISKSFCNGNVVSILEGGYDLKALQESTKKHVDALSTDGTVANHFKTKLGLQLSLAPSNKLLDSISEEEAEKETAFLDRLQKHLENFSVSNNDES